MKTVLDRIVELAKAQGLSEGEVCRRAGINPSGISVLRQRTRTKPDASLSAPRLVAIADVLGVTPGYLATGERRESKVDSAYPNRDRASEAARLLGFSEGAIRSVSEQTPKHDLPVKVWFQRIQLADAELEAATG